MTLDEFKAQLHASHTSTDDLIEMLYAAKFGTIQTEEQEMSNYTKWAERFPAGWWGEDKGSDAGQPLCPSGGEVTDFTDCPICQRTVLAVCCPDGSRHPASHRAKCGVWCMGGAVDAIHKRTRNTHGSNIFPCPKCGPKDAE